VARSPQATGAGAAASAGRPRSEEAHRAILDATLALLAEVGFSALSVEGVAARAGVAKATIYRRWASKAPLVVEAFQGLPGLEEVDTGELADDLESMLRSYVRQFNTTPLGDALPSLAGERAHDPELGRLLDPVLRERSRPLVRRLRQAVERGELPAGLDLELASDLIVGPIAVRLYTLGRRPRPEMLRPAIELALRGIANPESGATLHRDDATPGRVE
jgi:AcrR family transcriptional regulator